MEIMIIFPYYLSEISSRGKKKGRVGLDLVNQELIGL